MSSKNHNDNGLEFTPTLETQELEFVPTIEKHHNNRAIDPMCYPTISANTVFLFGSGVSIWSPCDVPMGSTISSSILSLIFGEKTICMFKEHGLETYLSWIPFETINEYAPQSIKLSEIYAKIFHTKEYNLLHEQLVSLASLKGVAALITTNCDNGIELVPGSERVLMPVYNSKPSESERIPYFKVHGSVTDSDSLVYKLSQEAVLEKWKEEYLHQLLNDRELVVIGYSGIDFEICPVIAGSNVSKVYWGYKPGTTGEAYKTPGYRIIDKSHQVRAFPIDLKNGLPWLVGNADLQLTTRKEAISSCFNITSEERIIWGFQLASAISFSELAIDSLRNEIAINHIGNRITENDLGFPLFESGQFVDSAHCFISKAYDHLRSKNLESSICSLLGALDAYRAGGYTVRALLMLTISCWLTAIVRSPRVKTQANIKVVSMIKSFKVALSFVANTLKQKGKKPLIIPILLKALDYMAISKLNATKKAALESQNLFDIKHIEALYSLFQSGKEDTLSDVMSYRSLGYYSASTALFRKNELTDNPPQAVINEAISRFRLMSFMGNHQEAWKVAFRLKTITNGLESEKWNEHAVYHLKKCQYTYLYRKLMPIWVGRGAKVNEGV